MNQIKCPHCGEVFTVDASGFADILAQVRTHEFEQEIHTQLAKEKELLAVQAEVKLSELQNQLEKAKLENKSLATAAGASVAGMIILGPIGVVGGAFVHGKDVNIPAGAETYIQIKEQVELYGI